MTYRVYFNRRGPLPWSVDSGIGTEEWRTRAVVILGCECRMRFEPDQGDNDTAPTAWVDVLEAFAVQVVGAVELRRLSWFKRMWARAFNAW